MATMCVRSGLAATHVRLGRPSHNIKAAKVAQPVRRQAAIRGSVRMATTANLFTSFSAKKLGSGSLEAPVEGETVAFSEYSGKVIMVQNVATLWGTTVRDFMQMNELTDMFGDKFVALGFPSNQFGHQTQETDCEVLDVLKYVRPGNGYEPKFPMFTKMDVNGTTESEIFTFLKATLPYPYDDKGGAGADHITDFSTAQPPLWAPLRRSDITWNFEKFLINQNGVPVRRYSPKFPTIDVAADIKALVEGGPDALN